MIERFTIPVLAHTLGDEERRAADKVMERDGITTGPEAASFETELAAWTGSTSTLVVNSCTAALHLALLVCGVGPGDEVITTPVTFPATINVIRLTGARAVLVDIDPDTLNLDPTAVDKAINEQTKLILPVHMGGLACDMAALVGLARAHGLRVVSDAAHAIDSHLGGHHVAQYGDLSAFSFYATKNMTTIEGGALCGDADLVKRARLLSRHGLEFDWGGGNASVARRYEPVEPGFKYNLTDVAAAIGRVQLRRLPHLQQRRRVAAAAYDQALADHPVLVAPPGKERSQHGLYLYQTALRSSCAPDVVDAFSHAGIATAFYYRPLHHYRLYADAATGPLPHADSAVGRFVALPMHARLKDSDVERVVEVVDALKRSR